MRMKFRDQGPKYEKKEEKTMSKAAFHAMQLQYVEKMKRRKPAEEDPFSSDQGASHL